MSLSRALCAELCQIVADDLHGNDELSVGDRVEQVDGGYWVEVQAWVSDEALAHSRAETIPDYEVQPLAPTLEDVTAEIQKIGYHAGIYHTGGGIMCIAIAEVGVPLDRYRLIIGNECGWGADCYDANGKHTHSLNFSEIKPLDSALQIAETLVQAIIAQTYGWFWCCESN